MWVGLLWRLLPYLIGAGLLVAGWIYLDRACWSSACKSERTQNQTLRTQIEAAQQRATDLALLYAQTAEKADADLRRDRSTRAEQGRNLNARAANLDRSPTVSLSGDAVGLLRESSKHANSAPAPIRDQAPAVAVPGLSFSEAELVGRWAEAAIAYLDARSQWQACVNFYESIQSAAAAE